MTLKSLIRMFLIINESSELPADFQGWFRVSLFFLPLWQQAVSVTLVPSILITSQQVVLWNASAPINVNIFQCLVVVSHTTKISYIKTALQDSTTARVIKDPNKAFLVEITEREREREREELWTCQLPPQSQRRGLCKWFIARQHLRETKEGRLGHLWD